MIDKHADQKVLINFPIYPSHQQLLPFLCYRLKEIINTVRYLFRSIRELNFTPWTGRECTKISPAISGWESVYKCLPKFDQSTLILELFITFGNSRSGTKSDSEHCYYVNRFHNSRSRSRPIHAAILNHKLLINRHRVLSRSRSSPHFYFDAQNIFL